MDLKQQEKAFKDFRELCASITSTKNKDYCPDGIAFEEIKETAEEVGIKPSQALWVHFKKHFSAVKSYMQRGHVESEPIQGRLVDMANYCALLHMLIIEEEEKELRCS